MKSVTLWIIVAPIIVLEEYWSEHNHISLAKLSKKKPSRVFYLEPPMAPESTRIFNYLTSIFTPKFYCDNIF